jgi:hypothetical protein
MAANDLKIEITEEVATSTTLNRGTEAILTEDMLTAAATLVASGNYSAKAAINMVMQLNDLLAERTKRTY